MSATVLFVCPHGAGKSRIAAAWFNALAPPRWTATTAGLQPQPSVSVQMAEEIRRRVLDLLGSLDAGMTPRRRNSGAGTR